MWRMPGIARVCTPTFRCLQIWRGKAKLQEMSCTLLQTRYARKNPSSDAFCWSTNDSIPSNGSYKAFIARKEIKVSIRRLCGRVVEHPPERSQKCKHFAILRIFGEKDLRIFACFCKINLRISAFFDKIICVWQRSKVLCQDIFIEK